MSSDQPHPSNVLRDTPLVETLVPTEGSLEHGDSQPASDSSGSFHARIGHYRLLRELGRGGMGVVVLAHDTKLDRKVAIKQMRADGRTNARRFLREALAMAKLSHPNVIPIFEIGEREGSTFIVMEYVEGSTLRAWLETPRSYAEILTVFKAAARGLISAHEKGLVHRDFKPDNVMIGDDGRVRVMDFGLARVAKDPDEPSGEDLTLDREVSPVLQAVTQTGAVLGTPAYMAPEQLHGAPPDVKGDQFSFCITLYEALYGQRPLASETFGTRSLDDSVPAWLREIVRRGLARNSADRHESMQALLDALVVGELDHDAEHRAAPKYVFVAHDGADTLAVLRLCEDLLDHGVRTWLDIWELETRDDQHERSDAALIDAPVVLVCHGSAGGMRTSPALAARIERDPSTVHHVGLPGHVSPTIAEQPMSVLLDADNWDEAMLELARRLGIDRARQTWLSDEAERAGLEPEDLSPYRGLAVFREQDARWMFGRETEVGELVELFRADRTRFSTIIGASGSGKSSLVLAGLCPALRWGVLGDGCEWTIAYLRPGARPCEALAHALVQLQGPRDAIDDALQVKQLRDALLDETDTLRMVARSMSANGSKILLVVDQLEELFTEAGLGSEGESSGADAFVRNLLEATSAAAGFGNLWVVATLRADFVQRGLEVGELARVLKGGTYFALPPMGEQQIRAAIERPARRVGFTIEVKLVEKLVVASVHQAGRLPLLQHVLRELWQRRDPQRRVLAHDVYAETGGLEGAIAVAAERALEQLRRELGAQADDMTRKLMTRLVHLGDTTSGNTRRRVASHELGRDAATRRVLDAFIRDARVIVANEDDGVEVFEISHEALLREWTTLVAWLDADRDALRLRQELSSSAAALRARGGREYLWGKGRVEEAKRVLAASVVELNDAEQSFLASSERVVRQRERRIRGAVVGVLVAALVVIVLVLQKNEDIRTQKVAVEHKNVELGEREREQRWSLSVQRGLRAQMLIPENRESEALLLAVQAVGVHGPDWVDVPREAREGLEHVLADDAMIVDQGLVLKGHTSQVRAVAFFPDGTRLATASEDNTARIWDPLTGRLVAALQGHEGVIQDLTYSPDGARLATASWDQTARVWDSATGELIATLQGHEHNVTILVYSPDGTRLATGSEDKTARIWDPNTGNLIATLEGHGDSVPALAYSPDGSQLATGSADKIARIWDPNTGELITTLVGHQHYIFVLAYSPDGSRLATASVDGMVRVWDTQTGNLTGSLHGHEDTIMVLEYSTDGTRIATGSWDHTVRVWDPETSSLIATMQGHESAVYDLTYSPDGTCIASASDDSTARVWDPNDGRLIATLQGHDGAVRGLAYSPDGTRIATAGWDKTARIWDSTPHSRVGIVHGHDDIISAMAYSPDGTHIATGSRDNTARVWDPESGDLIVTLRGHEGAVRDLVYSPDGARIATAGADNVARVWDANTGTSIVTLQGHEGEVVALVYSPDGARIASASWDYTARVWDANTGTPAVVLRGHGDHVVGVVFSPDGTRLATASYDETARVWDPETGELVAIFRGHEDKLNRLAYSPNGTRIATTSWDHTARIWDPNTGAPIAILDVHKNSVFGVVFSPDGTRVATAGSDGTTQVWSPVAGDLLATLEGHENVTSAVTYSPDGTRIATASADHTSRIWDPNTGTLITTLEGHSGAIYQLVFSPDGTRIATGSTDHTVKVWNPQTGELITDLGDRIGLVQPDGSITWPIPAKTLTQIGCERLQSFEESYSEAAQLCEPLLAE
jgi:WD40 repeat protein/serine/threonine protein kinase